MDAAAEVVAPARPVLVSTDDGVNSSEEPPSVRTHSAAAAAAAEHVHC